jgi:hypothetical protein
MRFGRYACSNTYRGGYVSITHLPTTLQHPILVTQDKAQPNSATGPEIATTEDAFDLRIISHDYLTGPSPLNIVKWRGDTKNVNETLPVSLHEAER